MSVSDAELVDALSRAIGLYAHRVLEVARTERQPEKPRHVEQLTARQVANELKLSPARVYAMARDGELPSVRVGRRVLFRRDAVEAWAQERELRR